MAVVVVGGNSKNIGKTSVASALIGALREKHWLAMKITQHGHGICSQNGCECSCAVAEHRVSISEETDRSGKTDTSRFLRAGAVRALWIRTEQGQLSAAMPELMALIEAHAYVIVESNSLLEFFKPNIYLPVLKYDVEDFKPSARRMLARADALITIEAGGNIPKWVGELPGDTPRFPVAPPDYISVALVDFIRSRL
jgi:molybdopterin-guanine dinucleotide biosynthesis protein